MAKQVNPVSQYFANIQDYEALGQELMARVDEYRNYIYSSGRLSAWRLLFYVYYQEYATRAGSTNSGSHGQYAHMHVNQFKSILDRRRSMLLTSRVSWDTLAVNSDITSRQQTEVAKAMLSYYLHVKRLENKIEQLFQWGDLMGESFLAPTWDAHSGQVSATIPDPDTGKKQQIYEGDFKFAIFDGSRLVRDVHAKSFDDCQHFTTIGRANKYDEAAKYPKLAEKILSMPPPSEDERKFHFLEPIDAYNTDEIVVYHHYHKRTPACPAGRYVKFFSADTVVLATDLPYDEIPIVRYAPEDQLETPFGYSVSFLLLSLQETYSMVGDGIVTNHELFGVQNVYGIRGANMQYEQLAGGGNYIEGSPVAGTGVQDVMPKPLNLLNVSPDSYSFRNQLVQDMQIISGINNMARGQPPEGVEAGTAMALIQSMAIQSNSAGQTRVVQALEDLGNSMVSTARRYAQTKRMIEIVGEDEKRAVMSFSAADLTNVRRVFAALGNPLTETLAGRTSIAQDLIQAKMVNTPEEYIEVVKTGDLKSLTRTVTDELQLIHEENKMLSMGKPAIWMPTDNHDLHVREHAACLDDPEARNNPQIVQNAVDHINKHLMAQGKPPLNMNPQPPAPPAPPPGPPAGAPPPHPPGPPAPGGQTPHQNSGAIPPGPAPAPSGQAQLVGMPQPAQPPKMAHGGAVQIQEPHPHAPQPQGAQLLMSQPMAQLAALSPNMPQMPKNPLDKPQH